ncbi:MAG: tRNA (adenosine(37)-N6)-threonylcarbamoyltransferase complex transferase subunit TsaD [Polyangia bacterium]|jgi:N6-L-threonylcarbamoyladenine synthase
MLILGIETSCDETAAAVIEGGRIIRSNVISSQVLVHAEYGGVVPEVASRQHLATVVKVVRQALGDARVEAGALDGIAVTCGPGLVGPLLVGVETGKAMAYALGKPVVGVNHLAGHLAAVFLEDPRNPPPPPLPHLALLVSGGHTSLLRVDGKATTLLGSTRDDAAGEAFDKVAKLLGLGYPGGMVIDRLAATGDPAALQFPRPLRGRDDLDFSFSGLKTAVATRIEKEGRPAESGLADFCASFQAAVVDVLVRKARRALVREGLHDLVVCGGVAANRGLRAGLAAAAREDAFALYIPAPNLCTDNAAMIAIAGTWAIERGLAAGLDLSVDPGLPLS